MKLDVQTLAGKKSGSVELNDAIFGHEPRVDILHRMVRYQLAKRRAGTCLLYTSPSPRDATLSRMPSSA